MYGIALLKNPIQEYAWGSRTFIQELMGRPESLKKPLAEIWMGIHPNGPSLVLWHGNWIPLSELIQKDPKEVLGITVARRFSNKLPFLFKILAAAKPLSIQTHPNRAQALKGFQREEKQGISPGAHERNYKDQNHKPEIFCALRSSWALKGFREPREILALMERVGISPHMTFLSSTLGKGNGGSIKAFFSALIRLSKEIQSRMISEVVKSLKKSPDDDPAFAWVIKLHRFFPHDVMALSPLFLNLIHLEPGEAIHIVPGTLHAYLSGPGIELMTNSDNVLRAGLTNKHTDPNELMKIVNFNHEEGRILKGERLEGAGWVYPSQAEEFLLSVVSVRNDTPYWSPRVRSVEILICVKGRGEITDMPTKEVLHLSRGVSLIVPAMVEQYCIKGTATIYKASVPMGDTPHAGLRPQPNAFPATSGGGL